MQQLEEEKTLDEQPGALGFVSDKPMVRKRIRSR